MSRPPVASTKVERVERAKRERDTDLVAVEEPLQIIVEHGEPHRRRETPLALTMRTPGHDADLVMGFLFGEGVVSTADDLIRIRHCARSETPDNVIRAVLHERARVPNRLLERNLMVTSACGVCGERTVEGLFERGCSDIAVEEGVFAPSAIRDALASLESSQAWFRHTGGTHGAALFDRNGVLLLHREDVGRHNALDKLIGAWLRGGSHAPGECFVVVSSRASFELVQKTVRARFPLLVAMGAPSSLAVETAKRFRLTLIGFAKANRFNLYSGNERIGADPRGFLVVEGGAGR